MELAVLLPIAAFVALAAGLVVVLPPGRPDRRADPRGRGVPDRPSATWRRAIDSSLDGAAGRIDAVRRRQLAPRRDRRDPRRPRRTPSSATSTRRARSTARAGDADPGRHRRRARAGRPGARDGRARHDDPRPGAPPRPRARGADVDQARLPQPAPRPRGDRPARRGAPRTWSTDGVGRVPPDAARRGACRSLTPPDHTM